MKASVTAKDIQYLTEAIDAAEGWRGSLDPADWDEFNADIAAMREAVKRVQKDRATLRKLVKEQG